jgi:hypothetical protein
MRLELTIPRVFGPVADLHLGRRQSMSKRGWPALILLGLTLAVPVRAQGPVEDRRSHVPIDFAADSLNKAREIIEKKLGRARALTGLQQLAEGVLRDPAKYGLTPEDLQKLAKFKDKLDPNDPTLSDPALRDIVNKLMEKDATKDLIKKIPPEQLKEMKEALKPSSDPGPASRPTTKIKPTPTEELQPSGSRTGRLLDLRSLPRFGVPGQGITPRMDRFGRQIVHWLGLEDSVTASSPLGQAMAKMLKGGPPGTKGQVEGLPSLRRVLHLDQVWTRLRRDYNFSSLSSLADLDLSGRVTRGGGDIGTGVVAQPTLLVGILVGVAVLVMAWSALSWRREIVQRRQQEGRKLGPWPVDPGAVRTREQLIKAFEYLSVLGLGPAARNWNHRQIARGLGATRSLDDPRRAAAESLAFLYEQARYAPRNEPLRDTEMATARRDLSFLAGVATA